MVQSGADPLGYSLQERMLRSYTFKVRSIKTLFIDAKIAEHGPRLVAFHPRVGTNLPDQWQDQMLPIR
jgi:hypothetical protein